jgi:type IX secretion system PorP/SprF family membrane protein
MSILKRTSLAILLVLAALFSKGQQDPMYSQYIYNLQTVNPAYAGSWGTIGFLGLSRLQWIGLEGHPSTHSFSFQMPINKKNVGVGFNVLYDKVGLETKLSVAFDYSFRIELKELTYLRFGIKGGFTNYSNNMTSYTQYPDGMIDPAFQAIVSNKFMPNVGAGVYLEAPKYFVSLSLPKIIQNSFQSNVTNFSTKSEIRHFFLAGGMLFDMSSFLKFKPTFMTHMVAGAPFEFDLSANFLLGDRVWLGGMYRSGDAVSLMVTWIVNQNLRIGYAHDFTTTELNNYQRGVHEVMLTYEIALARRKFISPRYF